jgi:transposase
LPLRVRVSNCAPRETVASTTFILTRKGERQKLAAAIKRSMRRPAQAHAGKRSRQDQFNCVFTDCKSSLQADINASTNLVRRYRDRLEKSTRAYSAWDEPAERERIAADLTLKEPVRGETGSGGH